MAGRMELSQHAYHRSADATMRSASGIERRALRATVVHRFRKPLGNQCASTQDAHQQQDVEQDFHKLFDKHG